MNDKFVIFKAPRGKVSLEETRLKFLSGIFASYKILKGDDEGILGLFTIKLHTVSQLEQVCFFTERTLLQVHGGVRH